MPAGIMDAICTYVAANYNNGAGTNVWDGEVHRYDPSGQTVGPDSSGGSANWPVIRFYMSETGFTRNWTFEDPYYDEGEIYCRIFHSTRAQTEAAMDNVEFLLASITNWTAISNLLPLGNSIQNQNPPYVIQLLLKRWGCIQVEDAPRTMKSQLIYMGSLDYSCFVHGAVPTS